METLLLTSSGSDIEIAADLLRCGEIVAFPTETVYGLGACIFDKQAVLKIFSAKGRPANNPLIAHISAPEQAADIAVEIPPEYAALAKKYFPGPLTIVLRRNSEVRPIVSGGLDTIALRMPAHDVALKVIANVGRPLVAPSANISGRPSPTSAKHVLDDLNGVIAAVIDGGNCKVGIESTVLSLVSSSGKPLILRPGAITAEDLSNTLGRNVEYAFDSDLAASPGTRYRHYAPNAKVSILSPINNVPQIAGHCIVLATSEPDSLPQNAEFRFLSANTLYFELRRADEVKANEVFIIITDDVSQQEGLLNRLTKAAGII